MSLPNLYLSAVYLDLKQFDDYCKELKGFLFAIEKNIWDMWIKVVLRSLFLELELIKLTFVLLLNK